MRSGTAPVPREDGLEINSPIEVQRAIGEDVNPMAFVVARCVQDRDLFHQVSLVFPEPGNK